MLVLLLILLLLKQRKAKAAPAARVSSDSSATGAKKRRSAPKEKRTSFERSRKGKGKRKDTMAVQEPVAEPKAGRMVPRLPSPSELIPLQDASDFPEIAAAGPVAVGSDGMINEPGWPTPGEVWAADASVKESADVASWQDEPQEDALVALATESEATSTHGWASDVDSDFDPTAGWETASDDDGAPPAEADATWQAEAKDETFDWTAGDAIDGWATSDVAEPSDSTESAAGAWEPAHDETPISSTGETSEWAVAEQLEEVPAVATAVVEEFDVSDWSMSAVDTDDTVAEVTPADDIPQIVWDPVDEDEDEPAAVMFEVTPEPTFEVEPEPVVEITPEPVAEVEPEPVVEAEPTFEVESEPVVQVEIEVEPVAEVAPEPTFEVAPEQVVEIAPEPVMEVEPLVAVAPEPTFEVAPEQVVEIAPEPTFEVDAEPILEVASEPVAEVAPEPAFQVEPAPIMEVEEEPVVEVAPEAERRHMVVLPQMPAVTEDDTLYSTVPFREEVAVAGPVATARSVVINPAARWASMAPGGVVQDRGAASPVDSWARLRPGMPTINRTPDNRDAHPVGTVADPAATAPSLAWWDVPSGVESDPRRGRFALGGYALQDGHQVVSGVTFRDGVVPPPTHWVIGPVVGEVAPGTLVLHVDGLLNCHADDLSVLTDPGFAPTTDGFSLRLAAAEMGPFAVSGTFIIT